MYTTRRRKYLGIDYGDRRVGLALAAEGSIAAPFVILENDGAFWEKLAAIVHDEAVTDAVIGWPVSLSGMENRRTEMTSRFHDELAGRFSIAVHVYDERLSTRAARRKKPRGSDDAVAAAEILQSYLDAHGIAAASV